MQTKKKIQIVNKPFAWFVGILGGIGISLCVFVAILAIFKLSDWVSALGIASTAISILLGVISIAYTFISGQETLKALDDIEKKYADFAEKVKTDLLITSVNERNAEKVRAIYDARLKVAEEIEKNRKATKKD